MTKRRRVPPEEARPGVLRSPHWAGLRPGDPVDVLDARERGATWRFEALVTTEAGASWVEVVGGRRGEERRRSFRQDQVYPHGSLQGTSARAASLDDAPQLPF